MIFNYILGPQEIDREKLKISSRTAIRAVVIKEDKILMVHTNRGDYKFPGGGAEVKESHEDTLKREVREETGYLVSTIKNKLGKVIERKLEENEENCVFEMTSHYYLCEVLDDKTKQQLDDYEAEQDFQAEWIQLDKVIGLNEEIVSSNDKNKNPWVYRETYVLKELREQCNQL